jgi:hypothetical protein
MESQPTWRNGHADVFRLVLVQRSMILVFVNTETTSSRGTATLQ